MWERATSATSYTLDNYFRGQLVDVSGAKGWFDRVGHGRRITYNPDTGDYTIHYHSNHWLVLHTKPQTRAAPAMDWDIAPGGLQAAAFPEHRPARPARKPGTQLGLFRIRSRRARRAGRR